MIKRFVVEVKYIDVEKMNDLIEVEASSEDEALKKVDAILEKTTKFDYISWIWNLEEKS